MNAREMEAEDIRTVRIAVEILPAEVRDDYIGDAWEKLREVKDLPGDKLAIVRRYIENQWREAERTRKSRDLGSRHTREKKTVVCEQIHENIAGRIEPQPDMLIDIAALPDHERNILGMISEGNTFDEIAKRLSISFTTIYKCIRRMRTKFAA